MHPSYDLWISVLKLIRITAIIEFPELIKALSNCEYGDLGFEDLTLCDWGQNSPKDLNGASHAPSF